MQKIRCCGTPYEIGHHHGSVAKDKVHGSIAFYKNLFKTTCSMDWPAVCAEASKYMDNLKKSYPRYREELRGIADGAGLDISEVLALNVRSEIMFGLFSSPSSSSKTAASEKFQTDGCTSLSYTTTSSSYLVQNWDWHVEQSPNILICHISQPGTPLPDFKMITEAGIIGKIGLNSRGVGVCINAIRARGVDPTKLPIHLALRTVLEATSREAAVAGIKAEGIAGSGFFLIADRLGAMGLECTSKGVVELPMDAGGRIMHCNHLILDHPGVDEPEWLEDSAVRLFRLGQLVNGRLLAPSPSSTSSSPTTIVDMASLFEVFKDEQGCPRGINRARDEEKGSDIETLFNIVMDLGNKRAMVTFGRPADQNERVYLDCSA